MRLARLPHTVQHLVVAHLALAPRVERLVVGRLEVLGLPGERLAPQRVGLGRPAEVEHRHRPVAEAVGRVAPRAGLRPRIGAGPRGLVDAAEHVGRLLQGTRPGRRILLEAAAEQLGHGVRHRRQPDHAPAALAEVAQRLGGGDAILPRALAGEHLEDRERPAPGVGAAGQLPARRLLRRHVGGSSRHADRRHQALGAGEAEVGDLGQAARGDHHVGRLHVAVHEPLLVRVVEAPGELHGHVQDSIERAQPLLADPVVQAAAVHVLDEQPRRAFDAAHVVAIDDVGVQAEPHPRLRLALEGFGPPRGSEGGRQRRLDGQVHVPAPVADAVDAAHASLAEDGRDLVQAEDEVADPPLGRRPRGLGGRHGGEQPGRAGPGRAGLLRGGHRPHTLGLEHGGRGRRRSGRFELRRGRGIPGRDGEARRAAGALERLARRAAGHVGAQAAPGADGGQRAHDTARSRASRNSRAVWYRSSNASVTARSTTAATASGRRGSRARIGTTPPRRITGSGSSPGRNSRA